MPPAELDVHQDICRRLDTFRRTGRIPNIIFHGPSGSGKHTLVRRFVADIYGNDAEMLKDYVMTSTSESRSAASGCVYGSDRLRRGGVIFP